MCGGRDDNCDDMNNCVGDVDDDYNKVREANDDVDNLVMVILIIMM